MSKINPNDRFPPSNLPTNATPWGRAIQDRLNNVERQTVANMQSLAGMNRLFAAQLENISGQLNALAEQQTINAERLQVYPLLFSVTEGVKAGDWYYDQAGSPRGFYRVGTEQIIMPPAWARGGVLTAFTSVQAENIYKTDDNTQPKLYTTPGIGMPSSGWFWDAEIRPNEVSTLYHQSGGIVVEPDGGFPRTFSSAAGYVSYRPTLTWGVTDENDPDQLEVSMFNYEQDVLFMTTVTAMWY